MLQSYRIFDTVAEADAFCAECEKIIANPSRAAMGYKVVALDPGYAVVWFVRGQSNEIVAGGFATKGQMTH